MKQLKNSTNTWKQIYLTLNNKHFKIPPTKFKKNVYDYEKRISEKTFEYLLHHLDLNFHGETIKSDTFFLQPKIQPIKKNPSEIQIKVSILDLDIISTKMYKRHK